MSDLIDNVADKLAADVMEAMEKLGDVGLVDEVAQVIGASSPSTEEAFRTAARVRMAEQRARKFIAAKLAGQTVAAPVDSSADAPGTNIGGDH